MDHQLIALALLLEAVTSYVMELPPQLSLVFIQGFASVWGEGHLVPPLVLYIEDDSPEGGRGGPVRPSEVVQVAFGGLTLPVGVPHTLAQDHVVLLHFNTLTLL